MEDYTSMSVEDIKQEMTRLENEVELKKEARRSSKEKRTKLYELEEILRDRYITHVVNEDLIS